MGSVRTPSITAFTRPPVFIIFLAAKIPRKKQKNVAAKPVLMEIHSGLQSRLLKNSAIFLSSLVCLRKLLAKALP